MTASAAPPRRTATTAGHAARSRSARASRLRGALVVAGILPSSLVLAFTAKVVLMVVHEQSGLDRFGAGEFGAAAEEFAANRSLNLFEPWIAPFDEGAALHADGELDAAVDRYHEALVVVPAEEECTVRINLALAHEALGDAARKQRPRVAHRHWRTGVLVLAEGGCPQRSGRGEEQTADAGALDERLRAKLQPPGQPQGQRSDPDRDNSDRDDGGDRNDRDQQDPGRQRQDRPQDQRDGAEQEPPDPRQRELQERNERGAREREGWQDFIDDDDYSGEYEW